ncbi:MAG: MerR family transcriptional regulator [Desulfobacula sp.]|nr:MerR family transcriptional regulator [Desulfobacula sp.]
MKDSKSIADCSKETGLSQRQLRNYETRNYIDPPLRITCGEIRYRRYTPENIENIKVFKSYLDLGFTLPVAAAKTEAHQEKGVE